MGKRGPAAKPTKLKLLEGTFRPDRAPAHEPEPARGTPICPDWIVKARVAAAEWDRVVPELARLGLLTVIDGAELEGYVASYARAVAAGRHVKAHGLILKTPFGPKTNPSIPTARGGRRELRRNGAEYGL